MENEAIRATLARMVSDRRESYAALSRLIGRNSAYLQQYVRRGSPARLEERDRRILAEYLGVEDEALGGPSANGDKGAAIVSVSRLAVRASAGPGSLIEGEAAIGVHRFDRAWLRSIAPAGPDALSIITVSGDSMAPTLNDGDDVLIDRSETRDRLRDGIYVLRREGALMVKRVALAPTGATLTVSSDNPNYPTWPDCPAADVDLVGRVIWMGRTLA